jgi:hypothetical protein
MLLLSLLVCLVQVNPTSVNEGELSVAKATIIRNVALARKALEPSLSLQQHLHLLPYHSDLYSPTGHLPATNSSSSSGGGKTGPIGLFLRDRTASSVPIESEAFEVEIRGKRLADCVEALIGAVYLSAAAKADSAEAEAAAGGGSWGVSSISSVMPVSEAGLAAAAAFCEAAGVLPTGGCWLCCTVAARDRIAAGSWVSQLSGKVDGGREGTGCAVVLLPAGGVGCAAHSCWHCISVLWSWICLWSPE